MPFRSLNRFRSLARWPVDIAAAAALATEPSKLESCISNYYVVHIIHYLLYLHIYLFLPSFPGLTSRPVPLGTPPLLWTMRAKALGPVDGLFPQRLESDSRYPPVVLYAWLTSLPLSPSVRPSVCLFVSLYLSISIYIYIHTHIHMYIILFIPFWMYIYFNLFPFTICVLYLYV